MNLTKLTSRECRQHAFDFEIVVNVGARLSLLERLAYTVKATGNRDNLMGLYLSGKERAAGQRRGGGSGGGRRGRPERPRAVKEKFRGPIYRTRLSPREKEIGIETKITDPTFPAESFSRPSSRRVPTHTRAVYFRGDVNQTSKNTHGNIGPADVIAVLGESNSDDVSDWHDLNFCERRRVVSLDELKRHV